MTLGLLILVIFIIPKARKLQGPCIVFYIFSVIETLRSSPYICVARQARVSGCD